MMSHDHIGHAHRLRDLIPLEGAKKGAADHTHVFGLIIQCYVMHVTPLMTK